MISTQRETKTEKTTERGEHSLGRRRRRSVSFFFLFSHLPACLTSRYIHVFSALGVGGLGEA